MSVWRGSAAGASERMLDELEWYEFVEVGDFIGRGATALFVASGEHIEVRETPLLPSISPLPVLGEIGQLTSVVDFDGDGKDQLIDGWSSDDDSVRYRLLDVRPCE